VQIWAVRRGGVIHAGATLQPAPQRRVVDRLGYAKQELRVVGVALEVAEPVVIGNPQLTAPGTTGTRRRSTKSETLFRTMRLPSERVPRRSGDVFSAKSGLRKEGQARLPLSGVDDASS
jgi:hypothetical protein